MSSAASCSMFVHAGLSEIRERTRKPRHSGPAPSGTNSTEPMSMPLEEVQQLLRLRGSGRVVRLGVGEVGDVLVVPVAVSQSAREVTQLDSKGGRPWPLSEYHVLDSPPSGSKAESHMPTASKPGPR